MIAIADDHLFAPLAVEALSKEYISADVEVELLRAGDYNESGIGHFGFFRSKFKAKLWIEVLKWLNEH